MLARVSLLSLDIIPENHKCRLHGYCPYLQGDGALLEFIHQIRHTLPAGLNLSRVRLVSITSIAARSNSTGFGGYSASKHAAESFLDTIQVELPPWEIDV